MHSKGQYGQSQSVRPVGQPTGQRTYATPAFGHLSLTGRKFSSRGEQRSDDWHNPYSRSGTRPQRARDGDYNPLAYKAGKSSYFETPKPSYLSSKALSSSSTTSAHRTSSFSGGERNRSHSALGTSTERVTVLTPANQVKYRRPASVAGNRQASSHSRAPESEFSYGFGVTGSSFTSRNMFHPNQLSERPKSVGAVPVSDASRRRYPRLDRGLSKPVSTAPQHPPPNSQYTPMTIQQAPGIKHPNSPKDVSSIPSVIPNRLMTVTYPTYDRSLLLNAVSMIEEAPVNEHVDVDDLGGSLEMEGKSIPLNTPQSVGVATPSPSPPGSDTSSPVAAWDGEHPDDEANDVVVKLNNVVDQETLDIISETLEVETSTPVDEFPESSEEEVGYFERDDDSIMSERTKELLNLYPEEENDDLYIHPDKVGSETVEETISRIKRRLARDEPELTNHVLSESQMDFLVSGDREKTKQGTDVTNAKDNEVESLETDLKDETLEQGDDFSEESELEEGDGILISSSDEEEEDVGQSDVENSEVDSPELGDDSEQIRKLEEESGPTSPEVPEEENKGVLNAPLLYEVVDNSDQEKNLEVVDSSDLIEDPEDAGIHLISPKVLEVVPEGDLEDLLREESIIEASPLITPVVTPPPPELEDIAEIPKFILEEEEDDEEHDERIIDESSLGIIITHPSDDEDGGIGVDERVQDETHVPLLPPLVHPHDFISGVLHSPAVHRILNEDDLFDKAIADTVSQLFNGQINLLLPQYLSRSISPNFAPPPKEESVSPIPFSRSVDHHDLNAPLDSGIHLPDEDDFSVSSWAYSSDEDPELTASIEADPIVQLLKTNIRGYKEGLRAMKK